MDFTSGTSRYVTLGSVALLATLMTARWAPADGIDDTVAQVPLFLGTHRSVPPNVMFLLDDSGSMQFDMMPLEEVTTWMLPDPVNRVREQRFLWPQGSNPFVGGWGSYAYSVGGKSYAYLAGFEDNNRYHVWLRSPRNNSIFYDPDKTYRPWKHQDGTDFPDADPDCALRNPYDPARGCWSLTRLHDGPSGSPTDAEALWFRVVDPGIPQTYEPFLGIYEHPETGEVGFWPALYYNWAPDNPGCDPADVQDTDCYDKVEIRPGQSYTSPGGITRTYEEEIQNYANWYSYYRTRILAARAAIGRAFVDQDNRFRLGWGTINKGVSVVDGVSTDRIIAGVRDYDDAGRQAFYDWLYGQPIPAQGTPLGQALLAAGEYYRRADNRGPWSSTPGVDSGDEEHLACRMSATILMTDGYWMTYPPDLGNVDGTVGPIISGPDGREYQYIPRSPYRDNWSRMVADVAMYYWNRDLRPGLENVVPVTPENEAFWQHMITYTVGLGVQGSVDPEAAWAAVSSGAEIDWPDPNRWGNPAKLDDLLHAGINGRGGFFTTDDPETFGERLGAMLENIVRVAASAMYVAVSANSTSLRDSSFAVQASFDTVRWGGELTGAALGPDGRQTSELWRASELIPEPDQRTIFTYDEGHQAFVEFIGASLSSTLKARLVDAEAQDFELEVDRLVAYLRGDHTHEVRNQGRMRDRASRLGDIMNSTPVVSGHTSFGWFDLPSEEGGGYSGMNSYGHYLDNVKRNRGQTVYVGANDGMLHGFDDQGREFLGYIPRAVFPKLRELADTHYSHKYFVDGTPVIGDAYRDGWKTVLLGTTGSGGRGVFAIDITAAPSVELSHLLWDIDDSGAFAGDLGYTLGTPVIDRTAGGQWVAIIPNGYDSESKRAALFVIDLFTGQLIRKLVVEDPDGEGPNGLSGVFAVPDEYGLAVNYVYAGDLRGNLWKFDLSSSRPSDWDVAYGGQPVFRARGPEGQAQPITAAPDVSYHPLGGYLVLFGTGKYFSAGDPGDASVQSLYGIQDTGAGPITGGREVLQRQSITRGRVADSESGELSVRDISTHPVNWSDQRGWYMDLVVADEATSGERVIRKPLVTLGRVFFSTYLPDAASDGDDPCGSIGGGRSWLYQLSALHGTGMMALSDGYTYLGEPACPKENQCGAVELAAGPPLSPPVVAGEPSNEHGALQGRQVLLALLPGSTLNDPINSIEVASIRTGRVRWRQVMQ